jgi:hypothetical protein
MADKDPIESIAKNWCRVRYLASQHLLPISQLPLKFK